MQVCISAFDKLPCKRWLTAKTPRRTNEKWSDPDFDIESDFGTNNCLHGLPLDSDSDSESEPDVDGAAVTSALNTIAAAKIMPGI